MIYYEGDKIPLLKDKFIVGSYSGDLYVLRLDKVTKEITEEFKIDLENYPFKPVVGLSESPNGDLYFGAYAIFQLNATNVHPKRQYMFPIEINSSSTSNIEAMQFDPKESKMVIDLNNGGISPNVNTTIQPSTSSLILKIPKVLLNNIIGVVDTEGHKQIQFDVSNSTNPGYNTVSIQTPRVPHLQLTILGSTLAMPGEQILTG